MAFALLLGLTTSAVSAQDLDCTGCDTPLVVCAGSSVCDVLDIDGGTGPYTYTFSSNVNPSSASSLCAMDFVGSAQGVTLTLEVTYGGGDTETFEIDLTVQNPDADFSFPTADPCSADCVPMTDESSCIDCVDYTWTVNGGVVDAAQGQTSPCLDMLSTGSGTANQSVGLTIETSAGCTSSITQTVTVAQAPFTNLNALPSFEQCNGSATFDLVVTELVTADLGDYQITWDIDDPGSDVWTGTGPPSGETYGYPPGIYTLEYCVTGTNGCTQCTEQQVTNLPNPNLAFNVCDNFPVSGCAPFDICLEVNNTLGNPGETNYFLDIDGIGQVDITSDIQDCSVEPCIINAQLPTSTCDGTGEADVVATLIAALPNGACVENEQSQVFAVAAPPVANIDADEEVCLGSPLTVQNFSTPGTGLNCNATNQFTWTVDGEVQGTQFSVSNFSWTFATTGTHTIELCINDFTCDVACETITVCVTEPPVPSFDDVPILCAGDVWDAVNTSQLGQCSHAYQWTVSQLSTSCWSGGTAYQFVSGTGSGSEDVSIQFLAAGTYQVSLDILGACPVAPYTQTIEVQAPPQIATQAADVICPDETLCLDQLFCIANCRGPLTAFSLEVYPGSVTCGSPTGTPVYSNTTIPSSQTSTPCTSFGGCSYPWSGPHDPGTYTVQISVTNACGTETVCVPVTVQELLPLDLSIPLEVCGGTTLDLCAFGACDFEYWSGTAWIPITTCDFTLNGGTLLRALCTQGNCLVTEEYDIQAFDAPVLTLNGPTVVCPEEEATFTLDLTPLPPDVDITWLVNSTSFATDVTSISFTPTAPTDIDVLVDVNHPNGQTCSYVVSTEVDVFVQPYTFSCAPVDPSYCLGTAATITLSSLFSPYPGDAVLDCTLNGDPISGSIDIASLPAGDYTIECVFTGASAPFCQFVHTCDFSISDLIPTAITGDPEYCLGETVLLELGANPGLPGNWAWTSCPGGCPTNQTVTATTFSWDSSGALPGEYSVQFSGACLATSTFTFTLNETPPFTLTAVPGATLCEGETVTIDLMYSGSSDVASCDWLELPGTPVTPEADCSIEVTPTDLNTSYQVHVVDDAGCEATQTIDLTIQQQPFAWDCSGIASPYCANATDVIDPASFMSGLTSSGTNTCTLNGDPIAGPIAVNTLDPGVYEVECVFEQDVAPFCTFTNTCTFEVVGLSLPELDAPVGVCVGETLVVDLVANDGPDGGWTTAACPGGDCAGVFPTTTVTQLTLNTAGLAPGIYTFTYGGECLETATIDVEVYALPTFTIASDLGTVICADDQPELSLDYTGSAALDQCDWLALPGTVLTPDVDCAVVVSPTGDASYQATVTDLNGCQATETVDITIQQQPFVWDCSGLDSPYCANAPDIIDPASFLSALTETGTTTCTLNGDPMPAPVPVNTLGPGLYEVECVFEMDSAPFCVFTNTCTFEVVPLTTPTLTADPGVCSGEVMTVTVSDNNGLAGSWTITGCPSGACGGLGFTGTATSFNMLTAGLDPGTYTLEYAGECLTTVDIEVELYPLPNFSVTADPGALICAGDAVDLATLNLGGADFVDCQWIQLPLTPIASGGDCSITVVPTAASTSYQVQVTDENNCVALGLATIEIQQQPFALDCSPWAGGYCANTEETLVFSDVISPLPPNGTFAWTVNGEAQPSGQIYVPDLGPGTHDICYVYTHGDDPNCTFEGCCTVEVADLTLPVISGPTDYCQGEEVALSVDAPDAFPGAWTFTDCPGACPGLADFDQDADNLTWNSTGAALGTYTTQYTGECLDTAYYEVTLYQIPAVAWTPVDATPCLNECFELEEATLDFYDDSGWCLGGFDDCTALPTTFCPGEYGTGEPNTICLWATLNHDTPSGPLACTVEDCNVVDPVESPGGYPEMPETACPETSIDLGVNTALYDGCTFVLEDYPPFPDCDDVFIPTYGTFADTLFLAYSGCTDTLASTLFVPQPPSAELQLTYDPCVGDTDFELLNLEGDELEYLWEVDYILTDNTQQLPVPNPVPYGSVTGNVDTTFHITATIFNACNTLILTDSVEFIATPDISIDISEDLPFTGCAPEDIQFEIFLENTDFIDQVDWDFGVDYLDDLTFPNTVFPPVQEFLTFGVADTITVTAVATNICGSDVATVEFILFPPDVFVELPQFLGALCPGESMAVVPDDIGGSPWGIDVTITPDNAGVLWDETTETVTVEPGTEPGFYEIEYAVFGCGEDADITTLEVLSGADLDFEVDGDPCAGEVVQFLNLSSNASGFNWFFQNGETSTLTNPTTTFNIPGTYDVTLEATSTDGCPTTYIEPVVISGPNVLLTPLLPNACGGSLLSFSVPETGFLSMEWTVEQEGEDPVTYVASNQIEHLFTNTSGELEVYTVTVTATDFNLCTATNSTDVFIAPVPTAFFTYGGNEQCANGATIAFSNGSSAGTSSYWEFGDGEQSLELSPDHFYAEADNYVVTLTVTNAFGCQDTYQDILPCQDFDVYVPNAFTPDDDGVNDTFAPVIYGAEYLNFEDDDYTFYIADRWGDVIYRTNSPTDAWIGNVHGGEYYAQNDVYIWHLEFTMPSGEPYRRTGRVTLVR